MQFNNQGIEILDVSFYQAIRRDQYGKLLPPEQQKEIDFNKMKSSGISAVVIRAGEHTYKDSEFDISWRNAKLAGLSRATYWFCDKDSSPKSQANLFWSLVKNDPPEGFLAGDLETGSWTNLDDWYVFFNELQQISGLQNKKIFFYSNYYYFTENVIRNRNTSAQMKWFSDRYPLWIAGYSSSPYGIQIPGTWEKATLWQDGTPAIGLSVGVWSKEVDHNYFNGDANEFNDYFGSSPSQKPEEPPIVIVTGKQYKCTASALNIRPLPSTQQSPLGVLKFNDVVDEVSNNADGSWKQIKTSSGLAGWCYSQYLASINPVVDKSNVEDIDNEYWFVLHDFQMPPWTPRKMYDGKKVKGKKGTPEIFRAGEIDNPNNQYSIKLDSKLQFFWFDIASLYVFGRVHNKLTKAEYNWLLKRWIASGSDERAYNNGHGLDKFRNYVANARAGKELPVLFTLLAGGASVRGTEVMSSKGLKMVRLQCFDPSNLPDPTTLDIQKDPRIMWATNISNKKVPGGYSVSRFPMFSEPEKGIYRDVPIPLISNKPLYYYYDRMKFYIFDKKWSPYFP